MRWNLSGLKTYIASGAVIAASAALGFEHRLELGWALALVGGGLIAVGLRHAISTEIRKLGEHLTRQGGQVERR